MEANRETYYKNKRESIEESLKTDGTKVYIKGYFFFFFWLFLFCLYKCIILFFCSGNCTDDFGNHLWMFLSFFFSFRAFLLYYTHLVFFEAHYAMGISSYLVFFSSSFLYIVYRVLYQKVGAFVLSNGICLISIVISRKRVTILSNSHAVVRLTFRIDESCWL